MFDVDAVDLERAGSGVSTCTAGRFPCQMMQHNRTIWLVSLSHVFSSNSFLGLFMHVLRELHYFDKFETAQELELGCCIALADK